MKPPSTTSGRTLRTNESPEGDYRVSLTRKEQTDRTFAPLPLARLFIPRSHVYGGINPRAPSEISFFGVILFISSPLPRDRVFGSLEDCKKKIEIHSSIRLRF